MRASRAVGRIRAGSLRPGGSAPPPGVISLAMGEPDFPTPQPIVAAAVAALREGWTRYGDLNGDPELRALVAEQCGPGWTAEEVLITHGGSAGLAATILALVDPGDSVVLLDPTYSLYADQVHLAGGHPVRVPTRPDGHLDLDALAPALRGAKLLVLCNPGNPTGSVFTVEELHALGELVHGTDTAVLADEAYRDLVYDGRRFVSALEVPALRANLVLCVTLSKTYAMTGWRIGYVVAARPLMRAISLVHRGLNASVNAAVQRAALTALRLGPDLAAPMVAAYQARRDLVVRELAAVPGLDLPVRPEGAFYVFPRYHAKIRSAELVRLLAAGGVAVRAGGEFGPAGEGHVRISFATGEHQLTEGLRRLGEVLARCAV
ncbi:pyridoxal phosphate-dependent aminotransferase [Kutzneria albida]|uniref:Aspartate aminotransferase n=1 Tax=Kutzneria albida DSM 43870 TaxID=1449976 RepID=W5W504_9PSEU|nr:pyridoxal phosphate-dependent aminotransferase [Kutzneria albida]AHH95546.1 aspartate aminotransferase [Kutzneria albida DSM 43870]